MRQTKYINISNLDHTENNPYIQTLQYPHSKISITITKFPWNIKKYLNTDLHRPEIDH